MQRHGKKGRPGIRATVGFTPLMPPPSSLCSDAFDSTSGHNAAAADRRLEKPFNLRSRRSPRQELCCHTRNHWLISLPANARRSIPWPTREQPRDCLPVSATLVSCPSCEGSHSPCTLSRIRARCCGSSHFWRCVALGLTLHSGDYGFAAKTYGCCIYSSGLSTFVAFCRSGRILPFHGSL